MKKVCSLLCVVLWLLGTESTGQTRETLNIRKARLEPLWIEMMKDTAANYYLVEQAFQAYFSSHRMPPGEEEVMEEHPEERKARSRRELRREAQESALRQQVDRYERWHREMLPYVQPDGSLMSPSQRLAIWRKQLELQEASQQR